MEVLPKIETYEQQRLNVQRAIVAFLADPAMHLKGTGFTGNALLVQTRNEWWFEVWNRWDEGAGKSNGWMHMFPDLGEFDRMTGSPDHPDTYGLRVVETVADALAGAFE